MITVIAWIYWMMTRETHFVGLTWENLKKLEWSIGGPDFELTLIVDMIMCVIILIVLAVKFYNEYKKSSSKERS